MQEYPTSAPAPVPLLELLKREFGAAEEIPNGIIRVKRIFFSYQIILLINPEACTAYIAPTYLSIFFSILAVGISPAFAVLLIWWIFWRNSKDMPTNLARANKIIQKNREGVYE
jgi:hypothetical protein